MGKSLFGLLIIVSSCIGATAQSATIVAQVSLTNQTLGIPRTTLVTPSADALYRVTAYFDLANGDALYTRWCLGFFYADDVARRGGDFLEITAPGDYLATAASTTFAAQVRAGMPLTYTTGVCNGGNKKDPYNLYITVEQLQ